jgi:predicted TIM-barrel fold metal-dependent hydrolase
MISRRRFARILTTTAVASAVTPFRALSSPYAENAGFETAYPDIPRLDSHDHIGRSADANIKNYLEVRKSVLADHKANIALWIDLDGGTRGYASGVKNGGMERLKLLGDGDRMIPSITDWYPANTISYSPSLIESRFSAGYIGYKLHWGSQNQTNAKYPWINDPVYDPTYETLQRIKMPLTSWHIEGNWVETGGGKKQWQNLADVLTRFPDLVIVHAHLGPGLGGVDGGIKGMSAMFDKFPNYYRDISTTVQHTYKENYDELRNFFIKYSDRLLYGTDKMEIKTAADVTRIARLYATQFEFYETSNLILTQYTGVTDENTPEYSKGLNLPREALEKIYYKNIIRVYPQLVQNMKILGFGNLVSAISTRDLNKPQIIMSGEELVINGLPEGVSGDIYSISGRKVASLPASSYDGTIRWNTTRADMPAGLYIVYLQDIHKRNYYSSKIILPGRH